MSSRESIHSAQDVSRLAARVHRDKWSVSRKTYKMKKSRICVISVKYQTSMSLCQLTKYNVRLWSSWLERSLWRTQLRPPSAKQARCSSSDSEDLQFLFFPIHRGEQLIAPRIIRLSQGIFARRGNGGNIILSIAIVLHKCNALSKLDGKLEN